MYLVKMYAFPFLLLTDDEQRNNTIADLLEQEMRDNDTLQKRLIDILPDILPKKLLYELEEIDTICTKLVVQIFRCDINVLLGSVSEVQSFDIMEKVKRLLSILRRRSVDILHTFDNFSFSDIIQKLELWDRHYCFTNRDVHTAHLVLLERLSDVHKHLICFISILKPYLLVSDRQLKRHSDKQFSERIDEMKNQIGHVLETTRKISNDIEQYITFTTFL